MLLAQAAINSVATTLRSGIDRVAGLYVINPGGTLIASAGRDVNLEASVVQSQGSAALQAGGSIQLGTINQLDSVDATRDSRNYTRFTQSRDIGSTVSASLTLAAEQDIYATAASLSSAQGAVQLSAGNNISLPAGPAQGSLATASYTSGSGLLGSMSSDVRSSGAITAAIGSSLSAATVSV